MDCRKNFETCEGDREMENGWRTRLGVLAALATGLMASGCHVVTYQGGGGGYSQAWYDVYGNYCGSGAPQPGCNFYANGRKIVDSEDPYYGSSNTLQYGSWYYVDSYGYDQSYYGWGWLSGTGILYDEYGNALNNQGDQDSRDLIGDVAEAEKAVVTAVGKQFAAKYALAEDAGVNIAKTLNDWATISKKQKRARTDADVADFSKRLYGVSIEKAQSAIDSAQKGDLAGLESLNSDVATHWGTSPETSKAILKSWYKKQLAEIGVNP